MSFVGDLFDSSKGAGYTGKDATITNATTQEQADKAYGQTQNGLSQQQNFINALQSQNGIGNQNSVFAQQQALAGQLQGMANGTGPNPALAQLNQTTGQNVQNQSALMASQRGAGANPALLARLAAQQGAATQQQAAGQAATMSAQQQIAATQALQAQQQAMAGTAAGQVANQAGALNSYNSAAQNQQQNLLNGIANQNSANVNMQGNKNNVDSSIAKGNQGFQAGVTSAVGQGIAKAIPMFADGGVVGEAPAMATPAAATPQMSGPQSYVAQILSGANSSQMPAADSPSSIIQDAMAAPAVQVQQAPMAAPLAMKQNNQNAQQSQAPAQMDPGNANVDAKIEAAGQALGKTLTSKIPDAKSMTPPGGGGDPSGMLAGAGEADAGGAAAGGMDMGALMESAGPLLMAAAKGGAILPPAKGQQMSGEAMAKGKQVVPGKASVKGDSLKNDTVPARLSPGEIVIPRHIAQGKDAPKKAAEFVAAVLAKQSLKKGK